MCSGTSANQTSASQASLVISFLKSLHVRKAVTKTACSGQVFEHRLEFLYPLRRYRPVGGHGLDQDEPAFLFEVQDHVRELAVLGEGEADPAQRVLLDMQALVRR